MAIADLEQEAEISEVGLREVDEYFISFDSKDYEGLPEDTLHVIYELFRGDLLSECRAHANGRANFYFERADKILRRRMGLGERK